MSDPFVTAMGVAASGMRAQGTRIRVVTENVANADTPGFRRKQVTFEEAADDAARHVQVDRVLDDRSRSAARARPGSPARRRGRIRRAVQRQCADRAGRPAGGATDLSGQHEPPSTRRARCTSARSTSCGDRGPFAMDPVVSRAIAGYAQVAAPATGRSGLAPEAQQGAGLRELLPLPGATVGQHHAGGRAGQHSRARRQAWTRSPWSRRSPPPSSPCKP